MGKFHHHSRKMKSPNRLVIRIYVSTKNFNYIFNGIRNAVLRIF